MKNKVFITFFFMSTYILNNFVFLNELFIIFFYFVSTISIFTLLLLTYTSVLSRLCVRIF